MNYREENVRRAVALNKSCKEQGVLLKLVCDSAGVFGRLEGEVSFYVAHGPDTFDTISKVLLGFGGIIVGDEISLI